MLQPAGGGAAGKTFCSSSPQVTYLQQGTVPDQTQDTVAAYPYANWYQSGPDPLPFGPISVGHDGNLTVLIPAFTLANPPGLGSVIYDRSVPLP